MEKRIDREEAMKMSMYNVTHMIEDLMIQREIIIRGKFMKTDEIDRIIQETSEKMMNDFARFSDVGFSKFCFKKMLNSMAKDFIRELENDEDYDD